MLRKYQVNERFFEIIDTEDKAYFLGFMYADGCVCQRKDKSWCISLTLHKKDKKIIERFRLALNSDHPIHYYKKRRQNSLLIGSKVIAQDLIKHGCIPRKSLILEFPTSVPEHLIKHFIRGYSDGDGCIYWGYRKERQTSIICRWEMAGTKNLLMGISDVLKKEVGIKGHIYKMGNIYRLSIFRNADFRKCLEWLYTDATIFLSRKHNKFEEWEKNREKQIKEKNNKYNNLLCDCNAKFYAKGFCEYHYRAQYRYDKKHGGI